MRSISLSFLLVVLTFYTAHGQSLNLSGNVMDGQSGEDLIGAHVLVKGHDIGGVTNRYGHFSIAISDTDSVDIAVSFLGYETLDTILHKNELAHHVAFSLKEQVTTMQTAVVIGNNESTYQASGIINISSKTIEQLPGFFGEKDLVKALQTMPGITSGGEGGSNLFVRGGTPDQNLYLLDDIPIYNINHLASFVSIFNTDAINNVELYKGDFPARYGGRLSSIVDVQIKEGDRNDFHLAASIGVISGKVMIEGPINSKMSYIASARRFWIDLITWPVSKLVFSGIGVGYNFGDYNFKLNYELSAKDHLYFSFYSGRDKIKYGGKGVSNTVETKSKFVQKWGNDAVGLRWNHLLGRRTFINTTLYYTHYVFNYTDRFEIASQKNESRTQVLSGISEVGFKTQWEWYLMPNLAIKPGAGLSMQYFNTGEYEYLKISDGIKVVDTLFKNELAKTLQPFAYLDVSYENHIIQINGGLRWAGLYGIDHELIKFSLLEPRISASVSVSNDLKILMGYSRMNQFQQLLSKSGVGLPAEIWVPVSDGIDPGQSTQWSMGMNYNWTNKAMNINASVFYKQLSNLIALKPGASLFTKDDRWQDKVIPGGTGDVKGFEFIYKKRVDNFNGWVSYTWMKSDRQFDQLNGGGKFPFRYDRRHEINVVGIYQMKENITLSATWTYHTGDAITLASQKYPAIANSDDGTDILPFFSFQEEAYLYESRNSYRMRNFHRLDLSVSFKKKLKKGFRSWDFTLINAYNRKNPYFYYYGYLGESNNSTGGAIPQDDEEIKLLQITIFPILPSVSYRRVF